VQDSSHEVLAEHEQDHDAAEAPHGAAHDSSADDDSSTRTAKLVAGIAGAGLAIGGIVLMTRRRTRARYGRWQHRATDRTRRTRVDQDDERRLDEALEETFPTSDPISVHVD
jgi:hypothetical protein